MRSSFFVSGDSAATSIRSSCRPRLRRFEYDEEKMRAAAWPCLLALVAFAACKAPSSAPEPAASLTPPTTASDAPRPDEGPPAFQRVELGANERHLYPRREDVSIAGISDADTGIAVALASDMPRFASFVYTVD